jgi:hypothetical protein
MATLMMQWKSTRWGKASNSPLQFLAPQEPLAHSNLGMALKCFSIIVSSFSLAAPMSSSIFSHDRMMTKVGMARTPYICDSACMAPTMSHVHLIRPFLSPIDSCFSHGAYPCKCNAHNKRPISSDTMYERCIPDAQYPGQTSKKRAGYARGRLCLVHCPFSNPCPSYPS